MSEHVKQWNAAMKKYQQSKNLVPDEAPVDVVVGDHGSVVLLHPQSEAAKEWIAENIGQENGFQPYWPAVVVEPRYVGAIVKGILDAGLVVN